MTRLKPLIGLLLILSTLLIGLEFCKRKEAESAPLRVGAYYFPWYAGPGPNGNWNKTNLRTRLTPPQMPVLGEYKSQDEAVIKQHIAWAQEAGINFFAMDWWGPNTLTDGTIRDNFAPYLVKTKSDFKFCIFYHTPGLLRSRVNRIGGLEIPLIPEAQEKLLDHFLYLARTYFSHPNYLKVNNRPVVVMYATRAMTEKVSETIQRLRTIVKSQTQQEIFIIGDEIYWEDPKPERIKTLDAMTVYNISGPARYHGPAGETGFFKDLETTFKKYQEVATQQGVKLVPNVMPGFNDRGVKPEKGHYIIPREVI